MTTNDEWPVVGAALGFPTLLSDSKRSPTGGQLLVSSPAVALRLQQLYQATLRLFDQAYISSTQARNLQTSGQAPPQPPQQQAELPQPTGADLETLLADVLPGLVSEAPSEVTRLLPQFPGTPGPELGIVGAPQHTIAFVEQNQRSAQDQNGVYAGLGTRSENAQPANIAWLCQAPGNQGPARSSVQSIPNYEQQLPPQQVCISSFIAPSKVGMPLACIHFQRLSLRAGRSFNTFAYVYLEGPHRLCYDIRIVCIVSGGP